MYSTDSAVLDHLLADTAGRRIDGANAAMTIAGMVQTPSDAARLMNMARVIFTGILPNVEDEWHALEIALSRLVPLTKTRADTFAISLHSCRLCVADYLAGETAAGRRPSREVYRGELLLDTLAAAIRLKPELLTGPDHNEKSVHAVN